MTFNYDRTLEGILSGIAKARIGEKLNSDIYDRLRSKIIHVYGSFFMPYIYDSNRKRFCAGNSSTGTARTECTPYDYLESAKNLSLIGDDRSAVAKQVREIVADSDRLVFLGFGFDSDNLKLLGLDQGTGSHSKKPHVISTAYGLIDKRRRELEALFPGVMLGGPTQGCRAFLEEIGGLL